jgi:glycerol-3-phosphate acyltransferase PlsY
MNPWVLCAAAYLAGSIPFGILLARAKSIDLRQVGSGNIGATNVWRSYGAWLGLPVIAVDMAKGFVPAFLATVYVDPLAGVLAGGAAMLGHWRPLFLGFQRGGKMVATATGAFIGVAPVLGAIAAAVWAVVFFAFRYASVASIVTACAVPVAAVALGEPWPVIVFTALAAVAVLILHRSNIGRLRAGTEKRFRFRRGAQPV